LFGPVEHVVYVAVQALRLGLEAIGAIVVALGGARAVAALVPQLAARGRPQAFGAVRLILARHLSLALEFQLAADILSTAISPSWEQIGKLGAIAVIRTSLNYFLAREIAGEVGGTGTSAEGVVA